MSYLDAPFLLAKHGQSFTALLINVIRINKSTLWTHLFNKRKLSFR
jgi:hypothetical protein